MDNTEHRPIVTSDEAYAIIRAILCLYSPNKSPEMQCNTNEKKMGPIIKKAFGLSNEQYNEISEKILEYSSEEVTASELRLRYEWRDNHPIYKSKAFKDPQGIEKWQKKELQDIKMLLRDPSDLDLNSKLQKKNGANHNNNNNNSNNSEKLKPSIQEIFGCTLKKHTLDKSNSGKDNIHTGYKILVNAFIQYSSQEVYREDRYQPLKASLLKKDLFNLGLLPEFSWVLNEYSILYGIRDFYRYLVIFEVLTTRFDDNLDQLTLLLDCLQKLQEIKKNGDCENNFITQDEDSLFNQISSHLFNNLVARIGNYRLCFSPNSKEKLPPPLTREYERVIKSQPITHALNLMKIIITEVFPDIVYHQVVIKAITESNEKEFIRLLEHFESNLTTKNIVNVNDYNKINLLSKVIDFIITKWFDLEMYYFNAAFTPVLKESKEKSQSSKNPEKLHLELVFDTFSNFINKSVNDIYHIFSKAEHTVIVSNSKLEPSPWITCLFTELVPLLIKYNDIVYGVFKKRPIPLEGDISFLTGQFILNRVTILNNNIKNLIKKQQWRANGKGLFHTSSPIDLFEFINQCYNHIQQLEVKLSIPSNPMTRSFGLNLGDTFIFYVKGIRNKILEDIPNDQSKLVCSIIDRSISNKITSKQLFLQFVEEVKLPKINNNITETMCYQINDIEHSRILLSDFDQQYDGIFKDSLNEMYITLKDHWNCLLTYYVFKLNCYIKPIIQSISLSLNENSTIISTKELTQFIENNLAMSNQKLQGNLFPVFLKRLFDAIVLDMIEIILPLKRNYIKAINARALSNFKGLMIELTKVFHGEGDKTSSYFDLTLIEYNKIKTIMELFSFSDEQLVEFHENLNKAHSTPNADSKNNDNYQNHNNVLKECATIMSYQRNESKLIEKYLTKLKLD
ncbi:hypothetical protein DICPUDRAFT_48051 [Dictyostelium purpureum]|uniref:MHD2 domain-containing protein n=1 Tax=Dictyostelium purpureum TaxID=5786 RepID=F0ZMK6_DICPU|nr:uncharacterized protein DICPUDRAFT_48051 [Dictyostelium purpureum]EGC34831.1 hypothetical protein DICPUDRAFT_48051 [Dictyostelium purpureum]|eukprot:XP_003288638.1 hypothetical protein DICPUDRAFT_48051 [Dictyostelium purpureum]